MRLVDAQLGRLLKALDRRNVLDETLVVVTSDHGDGIGERSRVQSGFRVAAHSAGIHESLLHVPLVARFPGQHDGKV
ncbi:MAG: sulfatase-like hydrolase/transferase, partial [Halobacteriaceae archaeon]